MRRFLFLMLFVVAAVAATGCKTKVEFQNSPPYPSAFRVRDGVIIAFPDELRARDYRVKVGSLWEAHVFVIPVHDAYKAEAAGRMKGIFTNGVSLANHSFVRSLMSNADLQDEFQENEDYIYEAQEGDRPESASRDLDTIMDEMARKDRGQSIDSNKSGSALALEALELSSIEMFEQRDPGFLLMFKDAQLGMIESRVVVSYSVSFIDWRSKNILFEKRYQGSSKVFDPYRNSKTNEKVLHDRVKEAFSGTMRQLMEDLIVATGAEGPPGPLTPTENQDDKSQPPRIDVPEDAAGMRLDTWLARREGAPSRNRVQQLIKDGHVKVNGEVPKRSYTLEGGEVIDICWPPPDDDWPWPQDIPLDILYEDDSVIIVNKQFGLIVHPSAGNPDGTMVNALLHRFPDLPGINGVKRPGIVHRLDRDTTGVMAVAKTERAMNSIARQLQNRTVSRRYLALIIGDPKWEETTVEADVGRDPSNRIKRAIDGPDPRHAISHFTVLRRSHQFTLIRCRLETGRTHQIRIHLKHIGSPIACDETYDGNVKRCVERLRPEQHELRRAFQHYDRPWLHAHTLEFSHPGLDGKRVFFQAPPPDDSVSLLRMIFGDAIDPIVGERIVNV